MLLLDSAVVIWVLVDSPRLGPATRKLIAEAPAVHASAVTVAELSIKAMLGRLDVPADLPGELAGQGFRELPLASRHADAARTLPELTHHDPFDRLLLAQAITDGLTLVTSDRTLLALGRDDVVDATV